MDPRKKDFSELPSGRHARIVAVQFAALIALAAFTVLLSLAAVWSFTSHAAPLGSGTLETASGTTVSAADVSAAPAAALAENPIQTGPATRAYTIPTSYVAMAKVELFLITGGVGGEINDRFGHIGLRVLNHADGSDVVFNWGEFSFDEPGFLWKFFRGHLTYSMGLAFFNVDVARYKTYGRRLEMNKLNLSDSQKFKLMARILWNADPMNRRFSYQYWYKNCATIPRDYLDEALGQKIRDRFINAPAHKVYRDYVRTNLALTPFIVPGLDAMMNANIDRPITIWEDMFLPANLQKWLLTMPAIDAAGNPVPGVSLLGPSEVLLDYPQEFASPIPVVSDYFLLALPLFGPLAVLLALWFWGNRKTYARNERRLLGAALSYWALLSGLMGLVLAINWALSGHADGWHNVNLLLFWPTDLIFLLPGVRLLRLQDMVRGLGNSPLAKMLRGMAAAHVALAVLLVAGSASGVVRQNIWLVVFWVGLPGSMLMTLAFLDLRRLGKAQAATEQKN